MSPPILAAADWIEILAALIFFLITGLAQWAQKRSQERRAANRPSPVRGSSMPDTSARPSPSSPPSAPPAEPLDDWQEELRRMLGGDEPAPPRPAPPPPPVHLPPPLPPPAGRSSRRPATGPLSESDPAPWETEQEESFSWEDRPAPERPLATLDEAASAYERGSRVESTSGSRLTTAASLAAARQAFQKASNLHARVSNRMQSAVDRTEAPGASHRTGAALRTASPTSRIALRNLLRHPDTARQAMLVATILQRPKALE